MEVEALFLGVAVNHLPLPKVELDLVVPGPVNHRHRPLITLNLIQLKTNQSSIICFNPVVGLRSIHSPLAQPFSSKSEVNHCGVPTVSPSLSDLKTLYSSHIFLRIIVKIIMLSMHYFSPVSRYQSGMLHG